MNRVSLGIPRFLFCGILLLALSGIAVAQFNSSVQGTVTDANGAAVAGATVTLNNPETGKSQQTATSEKGYYRFTGLAPGRYTIVVEQKGFKKQIVENIDVGAEITQGANIELEVGTVAETVTITDEAPPLQTENANVSKGITERELQRLPQAGRDPYELLRLTPGVFGDGARSATGGAVNLPNTSGPGGSNNSVFQVENQVPISANGQRVSANNYTIDGVSVNSLGWGGAAVVTPNQESVEEVRVLSSTYSAEDGRNSGAQIKVVSKSGTNDFHGSAFFKYNSPKLNAFNKFPRLSPTAGPTRVGNKQNQFGGSIGGPILRDRLFFFFSYEGLRANTANTTNAWVETPQYRQAVIAARSGSVTSRIFQSPGIEPRILGVIPQTCAQAGGIYTNPVNCQQVTGGLDVGSITGAVRTYVANSNIGGGLDGIPDIQFVQLSLPRQSEGNQYNFRFDYNREKDHIAFSSYITRRNDLGSDSAGRSRPMGDIRSTPLNTAGSIIYTRIISSTIVNELRFNATRFDFNEVESSVDTNFGIPRLEVEALPFDRIRFGAPRGETTPGVFAQNTYDISDVLNYLWNNHGFKFGVSFRFEQNNNNLVGGSRPLYSFTGMWNLANDAPIFEAINADPVTGAPIDAQRYLRSSNHSFFVQDDWKVRPNLTLNLGVRWEYFSPLSEKQGRLSNIALGPNGLFDAKVQPVDQLTNPDKNNFAPRIGFAYSPKMFNDKAVLRGGFGIAYNRPPNSAFSNVRGNPPFFARFGICCGNAGNPFVGGQILYTLGTSNSVNSYPVNPLLGGSIDPVTGGVSGRSVEVYAAERDYPTPYVYTYSLEAQYSLPYSLVASLGYQGSAGRHLMRLQNSKFIYRLTGSPVNDRFFAIFFPFPDVNTSYNAMLATVSRRFDKGLSFGANYRWAKSIDTGSYEGPCACNNQSYPFDQSQERGPSDFDVKHHFVAYGVYDLPIFRGQNNWKERVFGGIQFNAIVTAHSGYPWTPVTGQGISTPAGPSLGTTRRFKYLGGAGTGTSNNIFLTGGNFPGFAANGTPYFDKNVPATTLIGGIGRNVFRGPRYFSVDMSLAKEIRFPSIWALGENARLNMRVNFFNVFNQLNLTPFGFNTSSTNIDNANFGRATSGGAGRVVEFQARFSF